MSRTEFLERWACIGYDRKSNDHIKNGRQIIGKNGRGRLGLFCFCDKYIVSTSKDGEVSSFEIVRNEENFAKINEIETIDKPFIKDSKIIEGTYIECPLDKKYINLNTVKEAVTLRFGANSNFNVYLNNKIVNLFDFKDANRYESINYKENEIKIYTINKNKSTANLSSYEVVWWVNNRFVEHNTGNELNIDLDSSNKIVFIISADFLENEVKSDWSGFKASKTIEEVKQLISNKINQMMSEEINTTLKEKKVNIFKNSKKSIQHLNPVEQFEVGNYVDEILRKCDSITKKDLTNIVEVLVKMEVSNRKYAFFENNANILPKYSGKITEIVEKWSIDDAYIVLNELYHRIDLINKLEKLVDDPQTKELQQLQPLFQEGLWIFHPKYEGTTRFTSNKSLNRIMAELLNVKDYHSENSRKRPDFVVLENSTLNTHTSDYYLNDSEVIAGYDEVLIIELKKGGSIIGDDEKHQALKYAKDIKRHGHVDSNTKITAYVLGSKVDPFEKESNNEGNIEINPREYDLIIKTAKNRTFNLINKIKNVKGLTDIGDKEIETVLNETQKTFKV